MDEQADKQKDQYDAILRAAKDEYQKRSRELVRSGARSQESMLFLPKEVVKRSTFRRRTDEF